MKKYIVFFTLILIIFSGCKNSIDLSMPNSVPTPVISSNPYAGKYWQCAVKNGPFEARESPILFEYDDKLWLIGGRDNDYYNDVWRSDNGVDWICVTKNAVINPRIFTSSIVFKNKMWVIGGFRNAEIYNDVWNSDNGVDWNQITGNANFSPRFLHGVVVFNNTLYLFGGYNRINTKNDLWKSYDGLNWAPVNINGIQPRGVEGFLVFKDHIWIIGGINIINNSSFNNYNDVWKSNDGKNWQCVSTNANLPSGVNYYLVYNDCILSFGLRGISGETKNDVWRSYDGINWTKIIEQTDYYNRYNYGCIVFKNKLWVLCGYKGYGYPLYNDIWFSE
jgi:hypothetical protein